MFGENFVTIPISLRSFVTENGGFIAKTAVAFHGSGEIFKPLLGICLISLNLVINFCLGSLACGKHLVQALSPMFTLQCLTGKADKNNNFTCFDH